MMQAHDRLCSLSQRESNVCDCYLSRIPEGTLTVSGPPAEPVEAGREARECWVLRYKDSRKSDPWMHAHAGPVDPGSTYEVVHMREVIPAPAAPIKEADQITAGQKRAEERLSPGTVGGENPSPATNPGREEADPILPQPAGQTDAPPLIGTWRYNNGYLCNGSLCIMRADFDTGPTAEWVKELTDWMCATMNRAQESSAGRKEAEGLADAIATMNKMIPPLNYDPWDKLNAAWNIIRTALIGRSEPAKPFDIHTEAARWGYIPGRGGLRNPETGERLEP